MAFLDNSGDIILDAVLTDAGRLAMARGDGSFKITHFAVADDEIDYGLYNKTHSSGSAYYDLEILQTPVLEALTNASIGLKHKLVSYSDPNLLYMPVLKMNNSADGSSTKLNSVSTLGASVHIIAVDQNTMNLFGTVETNPGILNGVTPTRRASYVRIDQGLDTPEIPKDRPLPPDLIETQFSIQMDRRLGYPVSVNGNVRPSLRFIDNDNVATYILSSTRDNAGGRQSPGGFVSNIVSQTREEIITNAADQESVLQGPAGVKIQFKIRSSLDLQSDTTNFLFNRLGSTTSTVANADLGNTSSDQTFYYIDTKVRLTALSTGYSMDIPVRFVKKV